MEKISFLSKTYTDKIKGIAICFIVLGHIIQHIPMNIPFAKEILYIIGNINLIGVAVFFMISAYGNVSSIKNTPPPRDNNIFFYSKKVLLKIIRIYQVFFIALLIYCVLYFLFHYGHSFLNLKNFVYYFLTLTIPGFTIWYIKIQVVLYLTLLLLKFKNYDIYIFIICLIYVIFCIHFKIPHYWYISVLYFPVGCLLINRKKTILKYINYLDKRILNPLLTISLVICTAFILIGIRNLLGTFLFLLTGIFSIILISMLNNSIPSIFEKMSKYTLEIYIYHFVYIAIFKYLGINEYIKSLLIIVCTILTILLIQYFKSVRFKNL